MNNEQFRRLVLDTPSRTQDAPANPPNPPAAVSSSLGSRARSFIPMTPRSVGGAPGADFARQLAERNAASKPVKKFRSSVPKGSKLASGYHDRTHDRIDEDNDDKAKRVKALEEAMKLGQIDEATFEELRDEIAGGDISTTHLVKGLDRRLLERVRRGENVFSGKPKHESEQMANELDIDEEFEKLGDKEVAPVVHEKTVKKGVMAPPPPVSGVKRTRDAILAELKASRLAAAEAKKAAQPVLGPRFRKIGQKQEFPRIEIDERGREVLIIIDEDGHVKRKVRKLAPEGSKEEGNDRDLLMPDPKAKPLGMEVPELPPALEPEDEDIFEGAGDDYDPLAGLGSEDDSSSGSNEEGEVEHLDRRERTSEPAPKLSASDMPPPPPPSKQPPGSGPRNYFKDTLSATTDLTGKGTRNLRDDPAIIAALQKARTTNLGEEASSKLQGLSEEEQARLDRRAVLLSASDRDLEDIDMGFGSSRFEDVEDLEEKAPVKLSEWKGIGEDDGEEGYQRERGGQKRKRGPKKRKGDKNSAADVLKVLERRNQGK